MSLLDLILTQTGILLTAGIALFLLLAAILLSVVEQTRKTAATRARQKLLRAAQARMEAVATNLPEPVEPSVNVATSVEAPVMTSTAAAPLASGGLPGQVAATPENQPGEPAPDVMSSAMQSILSSVFGDDETAAKYDRLLNGLEPIRIEHLRTLSLQITEQLREQSGSLAHREGEHR